jgi:hypothetical protein
MEAEFVAAPLTVMILCYLAAFETKRGWALTTGAWRGRLSGSDDLNSPVAAGSDNSRFVQADYSNSLLLLTQVLPFALAALAGLKWMMNRWSLPAYLQMLVLFASVVGDVTLGDVGFGVAVLPQANRYQLEMSVGRLKCFLAESSSTAFI